MNILYTSPAYVPAYRAGGPVMTLKATAERLARRGHEVTVLTSNANLEEDLDVSTNRPVDVNGVAVWYFRRNSLLPDWITSRNRLSGAMGFVYTPDLRSRIDSLVSRADVVHTQMPFTYGTMLASRATRRLRKPLFYSQHGVLDAARLQFRSFKKRLYLAAVERAVMNSATMLIALTEWERRSYSELGVSTPCSIVPNGIDPDDFTGADPGYAERKWGIQPGQVVLLFMGRLHPLKGPDQLLRAFLSIANRRRDALLVVAGPDEWSMEKSMRAEALAAGLGDRVIFPGMVTGADKKALLSRADLFCLPSRSEGFSVAVLEAMASGTAVLLSPQCHFDDIESRQAGKLAAGDADALASALGEMLGDRDLLRRMGSCARAAAAEFCWDRIVSTLVALYSSAAKPTHEAAVRLCD